MILHLSTTGGRSFPGGHEAAYTLPNVDSSMCSNFFFVIESDFFSVAIQKLKYAHFSNSS
jgi:hypothetical protein